MENQTSLARQNATTNTDPTKGRLFVIRFMDYDGRIYTYYKEDCEGFNTGENLVFDGELAAQDFLNTLDEREFYRWIEEATEDDLLKNTP